MILIISNDKDTETKEVARWLDLFNKNYLIETNYFNLFKPDYFDKFKSIWVRKLHSKPVKLSKDKYSFDSSINIFLQDELRSTLPYLEEKVVGKSVIGSIQKTDLNKIETLLIARKIGLVVPDFAIVNRKKELKKFLNVHNQLISKPITNIRGFHDLNSNNLIIPYTSNYTEDDLELIPDVFYPSFIQKKINKRLEIKGFYFNGQIISISIYSELQNKITDLKQVISNDPNARITPFALPEYIKTLTSKLFSKLNLNMGTFDLILDHKNMYNFLEINPSGQFDKIEQVCNGDIYKIIAETLMKI